MAVLSLSTRRATRLAAALLVLAGAGCMILERFAPGSGDAFAFSHRVHVEGEGLDCVSCHETANVDEDPGLPALDTCLACHATLDAGKPAERSVASLYEGERFRATLASRLGAERVFSHLRHVAANEDCGVCHTGIAANDRVTAGIGVTMAACMECHARRQAPNECATCHLEVGADWAPPSHREAWSRLHGQVVRAGSTASADSCALCHQESTCLACHRDEPPRSHDNHFRLRGHGVAAQMDRANCAACHEPDSCERCHAETRPQNHRGLWGAPTDTHCLGCHFPLASEGCFVCHQDAPSHLLATPLPVNPPLPTPPHNPAMNCRQCHGISAPLPHVDKGDECTLCHL